MRQTRCLRHTNHFLIEEEDKEIPVCQIVCHNNKRLILKNLFIDLKHIFINLERDTPIMISKIRLSIIQLHLIYLACAMQ